MSSFSGHLSNVLGGAPMPLRPRPFGLDPNIFPFRRRANGKQIGVFEVWILKNVIHKKSKSKFCPPDNTDMAQQKDWEWMVHVGPPGQNN